MSYMINQTFSDIRYKLLHFLTSNYAKPEKLLFSLKTASVKKTVVKVIIKFNM